MSKSISMVTAGLLTIGILVVGGPVQAGLDDASVGLNGTANFTGAGGPDANIDYVVVYRAGGVTLDHLNDNVFTGVNLTTADDGHWLTVEQELNALFARVLHFAT